MKSIAAVLLCAASVLAMPAMASEADYPSRPITIVIPFPPGGSPDVLARAIGEKFQQRTGQSFVVENRPGASGTIGSERVARAAPDGYTLMMAPNTFVLSPLVLPKSVVNYDTQTDFAPVILPAKTVLVLAAHPSLGVKSLDQLVKLAKSRSNITYTGAPSGSPQHVAGEMLKQAAGFDMAFVPYKGLAPALTDTLGGHVGLIFAPYANLAQYLQSGALVALGGLDKERSPIAPGIVPFAEQGYPDMVVGIWTGLFAPRGTPAPIIEKLNKEINAILQMPDVRQKLESAGQILVGGPPEVLARQVKRDTEAYAPIVRQANIKAE